MNDGLNVLELILEASLPVQLVMLLLVLASVASWTIILRKKKVLDDAVREADAFEERFWSGAELSGLFRDVSQQGGAPSGKQKWHSARLRPQQTGLGKCPSPADQAEMDQLGRSGCSPGGEVKNGTVRK